MKQEDRGEETREGYAGGRRSKEKNRRRNSIKILLTYFGASRLHPFLWRVVVPNGGVIKPQRYTTYEGETSLMNYALATRHKASCNNPMLLFTYTNIASTLLFMRNAINTSLTVT